MFLIMLEKRNEWLSYFSPYFVKYLSIYYSVMVKDQKFGELNVSYGIVKFSKGK